MEVVEVACLLEVVGDHEVEMEGVETEVGLVEVVANQEEVLHEVVVAVVVDSCLDRDPDDVVVAVEVGIALHPATEVASFLVEEGLLGVEVALESWAPFDPFLVPCCFAAVVEAAAVTVAVAVVAAVDLMWEAWEAVVVVRPSLVVVVVACLVVQEVMVDALDDAWVVEVMVVEECLVALSLEEVAY